MMFQTNYFKEKTFVGLYYQSSSCFYSVLTVSSDAGFQFSGHYTKAFLPKDFAKDVCIYTALPFAAVHLEQLPLARHQLKVLFIEGHQLQRYCYLGWMGNLQISLKASIDAFYLQELELKLGRKVCFEIDILALWHLIYWQMCQHQLLSMIGLWVYQYDFGFYVLLGRGESLWCYSYVNHIAEIQDWLKRMDWPKPTFYCVLNAKLELGLDDLQSIIIPSFEHWTISAALAIRGAYASV